LLLGLFLIGATRGQDNDVQRQFGEDAPLVPAWQRGDVAPDTVVDEDTLTGEEQITQKLRIVKRDYNHRRQVGVALGMMAFIGLILTSVQNWNPD
jgi:hypothetical protein